MVLKPTWRCPECGRPFWYGPASRVATENPCTGDYRGPSTEFRPHEPTALVRIEKENA